MRPAATANVGTTHQFPRRGLFYSLHVEHFNMQKIKYLIFLPLEDTLKVQESPPTTKPILFCKMVNGEVVQKPPC